ncbi:hypothetical protein OOZ51_15235 [Arthrobacter sp. MI7-26]|uniref:hypothetical protein n=1 Tax=Arthrobacter sp. MI7-26 TaxID=2993653 RepID=UPI002248880F|nr:hypothetical protein [Arthrobacter sp. MI7-26]MCX2749162.1 hypothetical protein [Arthrobacter sp. MI7-26]
MSDTIAQTAHEAGPPARTISIQPREIKEAAYRALCAAGADPAEAQEGAFAILRAESDNHNGLGQLKALIDADWETPSQPATAAPAFWDCGNLTDLVTTRQPGLRTALQLMDCALDSGADEISAARTSSPCIPAQLWNDLLIRRSASLQRTIILATSTAGTEKGETARIEYRTLTGQGVITSQEPPHRVINSLPDGHQDGEMTSIIVLPTTSPLDPKTSSIPTKPLKVSEQEWQKMYQLSRKFLVPDT